MVRRLSSARSRLFRSFRSLSKLRLEEGQRGNSQQQQPAGKRKRISRCPPFSAPRRVGCSSSEQRALSVLQKMPKCVNLPAKDHPLCVFLSVGPAQVWGTRGSVTLGHHQPQAPAKTLPQTDLEMSRTAERSQGFHDLWPHTPKLNTRNTQSRNRKNQRRLTRGMQTSDPLGTSKSLPSAEHTLSKCCGGAREGAGGLAPTTPVAEASSQGVREEKSPKAPA